MGVWAWGTVFVVANAIGVETFKALKNRETRHYGEYRTHRLVLEAWDELGARENVA